MILFIKIYYLICLFSLAFTLAFPCLNEEDEKCGIKIWQVALEGEMLTITKVKYGEMQNSNVFKTDKAYVIRITQVQQQNMIYYWIGKLSSMEIRQKAAKFAAKQMHMLSLLLPATVLVKRVTEGYESCDLYFRIAFRVQYECPESWKWKLYKVKGISKAYIMQVPVTITELNEDDSFVLDKMKSVAIWYGPNSNETEKKKANALGHRIQYIDHKWESTITFINNTLLENFKEQLGGKSKDIIQKTDTTNDYEFEEKRNSDRRITEYTNLVKRDITDMLSNSWQLDWKRSYLLSEKTTGHRIIYLGMFSKFKEIETTLEAGETSNMTDIWNNVVILQLQSNIILPTNLIILFRADVDNLLPPPV